MTQQTAAKNLKELGKLLDKKIAEGASKEEVQPIIDDIKILKELSKTKPQLQTETSEVINDEQAPVKKVIKSSEWDMEYHRQRYIRKALGEWTGKWLS